MRHWFGFGTALGIDIGSSNVRVYQQGRGVVLCEPAVAAVQRSDERLVAIGHEAWQMLGRTPGNIVAVSPVKGGVIAHYSITVAMLRHVLDRVCGRGRFVHPDVAVTLPCGATDVERRAVLDAAHEAGARRVYPIAVPMAAAIGAQLPVTAPRGHCIVDIGGGTTDIGVISLGGLVVSGAGRIGGFHFDDLISRYLRREYNLTVGDRTAEAVKWRIGAALPTDTALTMDVRGRDVVTGQPRTARLTSPEVATVCVEPLRAIADRVRQVLAETPPELAADILERGVLLCGGGAHLRHIDAWLSQALQVPTAVSADPRNGAVVGAGRYLETQRRQEGG